MIKTSLYCILHLFIGYAFCWWGGWVIWRRLRIDALTFRTVLYGFLFYVLAGGVLWHCALQMEGNYIHDCP